MNTRAILVAVALASVAGCQGSGLPTQSPVSVSTQSPAAPTPTSAPSPSSAPTIGPSTAPSPTSSPSPSVPSLTPSPTAITISGLILDPAGKPVGGARMILEDSTNAFADYIASSQTASDGSYELVVPPGRESSACLAVQAPAWPRITFGAADYFVDMGDVSSFHCVQLSQPVTSTLDFTLPELTPVRGRVADESNVSCAGYEVEGEWSAPDTGGEFTGYYGFGRVLTSDDGSYELHLVGGEDWDVYVWKGDAYSRTGSFKVRDKPINGKDVRSNWTC